MRNDGVLLLEDGTFFPGTIFGSDPKDAGPAGEVVFNTGMTGYYEILTDPSYTGQIVVMTYPHIGNYGVDPDWSETAEEAGVSRNTVKVTAYVVRKLYRGEVPQGREKLEDHLKKHGITGIEGVDTRKLTLHLREKGNLRGTIISAEANIDISIEILQNLPKMEGSSFLDSVGTEKSYVITKKGSTKIAMIDYGLKANILREAAARFGEITVFPSSVTDTDTILSGGFDGLLLSNGPGDPAVLKEQIGFIKKLLGKIPIFGICLGHQLLSLALGAKTYKLQFGHHGCNHPVKDGKTGKVYISSQNHGFAVDSNTLPQDTVLRFTNGNDGTVEGITNQSLHVFSVQFHPEAAPGPRDTLFLFDEFAELCTKGDKVL